MGVDDFFGIIGMLLGICCGIAPANSFIQGLKEMEIKNIAYSYLVFGVFNCLFWSCYGVQSNKFYIYATNLILLVIFIVYLNLFYYINKSQKEMPTHTAGIVILWLFTYFVLPTQLIGFIAFVVNTAWMATSLVTMKQALLNKDASFLNLQIAVITTLCTSFWLLYGLQVGDIFIILPNMIGAVLWACNFLIYYWSHGKIADDNIGIVILKKCLGINDQDDLSKEKSYTLKNNEQDF